MIQSLKAGSERVGGNCRSSTLTSLLDSSHYTPHLSRPCFVCQVHGDKQEGTLRTHPSRFVGSPAPK